MRHTTTFPRRYRAFATLVPTLLLWSLPAHAADEDTQAWLYFNGVVPIEEGTRATIEISPRWRDEGPDLLQTRVTFETALSSDVSVGAGAAYIEYAGGSEYRPHQQLSFRAGPLSFRTRLEERFFEGAPRPQIRFRQRVGTSVAVAPRTELTANVEYLYNLRPEQPGDEARIDSWRGLVGVQQDLSDSLTVEVDYHIILSPRENGPDKISHIPRMSLTKRF